MADVVLTAPTADTLDHVVATLRGWQHDGPPVPLHPGDLGWQQRHGTEATAAALRTWRRDGSILAIGLVDSPEVLRLAAAPQVQDDEVFCRRLVDDLTTRAHGLLPHDDACVEARLGGLLRGLLAEAGWTDDEPWAWSAGPGRPGLIEPLGVHPEHRGRGHGRAVTLAAAAALRELGSSSVTVCTPSANAAGVAAYAAAGFERLPDTPDLRRPRRGS